MANIICINGLESNEYLRQPLVDGRLPLGRLADVVQKLPEIEKIVLFSDGSLRLPELEAAGFPRCLEIVEAESWDAAAFMERLAAASAGYGAADMLFFIAAGAVLLDINLCRQLIENHRRFMADYTFADGYPLGLACEILNPTVTGRLAELAAKMDERAGRRLLFSVVEKDINRFAIETVLAPEDMRLLRLELFCDSRRNRRLLDDLLGAGGHDALSIIETVKKNPRLLRLLPAFYELQIFRGYRQPVDYLPPSFFKQPAAEMAVELFASILEQIAAFSGDAVVSFSLRGEPSCHSRLEELARIALTYPGIKILIESDGIDWPPQILEKLLAIGGDRLDWIILLDAVEPELYRKIRGEGLPRALKTIDFLQEKAPRKLWVQAMRLIEYEASLLPFYGYWQERNVRTIIQKYDNYCGLLPARKVTNYAPFNRTPCWRLKRETAILVDGVVPLCRQDIEAGRPPLGDLSKDSLADVWQRGQARYQEQLDGLYKPPCKECDEYYSFNF